MTPDALKAIEAARLGGSYTRDAAAREEARQKAADGLPPCGWCAGEVDRLAGCPVCRGTGHLVHEADLLDRLPSVVGWTRAEVRAFLERFGQRWTATAVRMALESGTADPAAFDVKDGQVVPLGGPPAPGPSAPLVPVAVGDLWTRDGRTWRVQRITEPGHAEEPTSRITRVTGLGTRVHVMIESQGDAIGETLANLRAKYSRVLAAPEPAPPPPVRAAPAPCEVCDGDGLVRVMVPAAQGATFVACPACGSATKAEPIGGDVRAQLDPTGRGFTRIVALYVRADRMPTAAQVERATRAAAAALTTEEG